MRDEHHASIGSLIAHLREEQGWSQRALAKWVGIDQSAVSRIEAGRRRLSADELQRFADALHVSADVLLKGSSDASAAAAGPLTPSREGHRSVEPIAVRRGMLYSRSSDDLDEDPASGAEPIAHDFRADLRAGYVAQAAPDEAFDPVVPARIRSTRAPGPGADRAARAARMPASARSGIPLIAGLPDEVAAVTRDWFALRGLAQATEPAQRWSTGHSAEGKPERVAHTASSLRPGPAAGDVLFDRVARFWRSELHVDPDDGPLPDLVPLLEDGYGAQIVVARVADASDLPASDRPVAAAFTAAGIPFVFVNAARPVILQRFALAHAFAHLVLGHGDVVDERVEWSRNVPPEAAANDFAEELLAPVRAVQRWYERRGPAPGPVDEGRPAGPRQRLRHQRLVHALPLPGREPAARQAVPAPQGRAPATRVGGAAAPGVPRRPARHACPPHTGRGPPAGRVRRAGGAARAGRHARLGAHGAAHGRLSLEEAAAMLHLETDAFAAQLARLGLD